MMKTNSTNSKPSRHHKRLIRILSLILLILCIILIVLCMKKIRFLNYTPDNSSESTETLSNPYAGFYTMTGITLSDTDTPSIPAALSSTDSSTELVMLEINLLQYRDRDINDAALSHLDTYFSSWKETGHQLIVRFLYDWDGNNLNSEPDTIDQIITHMKQVAPYVNKYDDIIYLMQGIFVGNCGEMNQSHYLNTESMTILMNTLDSNISSSIFLSVRTPLQRRMILNSAQTPGKEDAFDGSLSSRLGLFNDGMLGSANDTGTYGDGSHSTSETLAAWSRSDELDYQNRLCKYVPNGGEVITDNPYNDLENAISDLKAVHVSYLNKDYDPAVLNKWKQTLYTAISSSNNADTIATKEVFNSGPSKNATSVKGTSSEYTNWKDISGYDYIASHLGYRYVLESSHCTQTSPLDEKAELTFTVKNTGFSNAYRSFDVTLSVVDPEGELIDTIPVGTDTRSWNAGEATNETVSLPVRNYQSGSYQLYINISDPSLNRNIYLANDTSYTQYGYLMGHISVSNLPKNSK